MRDLKTSASIFQTLPSVNVRFIAECRSGGWLKKVARDFSRRRVFGELEFSCYCVAHSNALRRVS